MIIKKEKSKPGIVAWSNNPSPWEDGAGRS
jgi:hypothetical protein